MELILQEQAKTKHNINESIIQQLGIIEKQEVLSKWRNVKRGESREAGFSIQWSPCRSEVEENIEVEAIRVVPYHVKQMPTSLFEVLC